MARWAITWTRTSSATTTNSSREGRQPVMPERPPTSPASRQPAATSPRAAAHKYAVQTSRDARLQRQGHRRSQPGTPMPAPDDPGVSPPRGPRAGPPPRPRPFAERSGSATVNGRKRLACMTPMSAARSAPTCSRRATAPAFGLVAPRSAETTALATLPVCRRRATEPLAAAAAGWRSKAAARRGRIGRRQMAEPSCGQRSVDLLRTSSGSR
jgi:hypothetical protein